MKVVTTYVAFDQEEFDTAEECLAYEKGYSDAYLGILDAVTFYDMDGHEITIKPEEELSDFCNQMDDLMDYAWKIRVNKPITDDQNARLVDLFGHHLPQEIGYYEYDTNEWKWEKRG